jgi:hypothetical protein
MHYEAHRAPGTPSPVNAGTFPSQLDRAALQVWHNHFDWHIQNWDLGKQTQGAPASWVAVGPGAAVRPIADLDRSVAAAPDGWISLGHDLELISEHLQAQSAIHNEVVNEAVVEWCGCWRNPTRAFVRPTLDGEADSYFWLRVAFARDVTSRILSGQPLPFGLAKGRPDLTDHVKALDWFLTELWNAIGSYWLQMMFAGRERSKMRSTFKKE